MNPTTTTAEPAGRRHQTIARDENGVARRSRPSSRQAADYRGPARFVVEGAEHPVIVAVTAARGVWSPRRGPNGEVADYADETIHLEGGSLPATVIDKTGELHCADGHVVVGEFTVQGDFRILQLV